jgi:GNAT superfamily N-acetyltransferase
VDSPLDPGNALLLDAVEKFGAWGYVAEHNGRVCGFLSTLPKISCMRDGSHVAQADANPAKTLWLRCLAGGPVYGPEYARIGIATRMVEAALDDAARRGHLCVEASPHDPHMGRMYEKLGFARVAWLDPDSKQNVYYRKRLGV